jgi:hypothetical protein
MRFNCSSTICALVLVNAMAVVSARAAATTPQAATSNDAACVAIVLPSARGVDGDATAFSTSLRDLFASYLTGPSLRAVPLDARLTSQAVEEARQKNCGFILVTSVTRVRDDGGGMGRAFGRAAGAAASYGVPYGGTAATAAARGAVVAGAYAISNAAETTKAKDEITLEYRISTLDGAGSTAAKRQKAKAKSDGEDLLTPLVESAAEAVAAVVSKK